MRLARQAIGLIALVAMTGCGWAVEADPASEAGSVADASLATSDDQSAATPTVGQTTAHEGSMGSDVGSGPHVDVGMDPTADVASREAGDEVIEGDAPSEGDATTCACALVGQPCERCGCCPGLACAQQDCHYGLQ